MKSSADGVGDGWLAGEMIRVENNCRSEGNGRVVNGGEREMAVIMT